MAPGDILGPEPLTLAELTRRLAGGARFVQSMVRTASEIELVDEPDLVFVVAANGTMRAATDQGNLVARDGDLLVSLHPGRT